MTAVRRAATARRSPRPRLRMVSGPETPWTLGGTVVGVGLVLLLGALFGLAISHTMLAQGQTRLEDLEARRDEADEINRELQTEAAGRESPARIVAVATRDLGMVRPDEIAWLHAVDPSTELTEEAVQELLAAPGAGGGT